MKAVFCGWNIAGLFDPAMPPEYIGKEIMKCLDLAKDGVHALLLVLSVRNRFTAEEVAAVESLQTIFGDKVVNYMIVVFTGGDELEENEETLQQYLDSGAPPYLKVIWLSISYNSFYHLNMLSSLKFQYHS